MSTKKKVAPILPLPVKPFTLRLVNGHFVRIPKFDQLPATDATRPPAAPRQEASPHGDGTVLHRGLRLVNGRFVNGPEPAEAPVQIPPTPGPTVVPRVAAQAPAEPTPDSWAYAFGTKADPSDSLPKG